jgi:hypothetical protein
VKKLTFAKALFGCLFAIVILQGCTKESGTLADVAPEKELSKVEQVLRDAISNQDYRLYGSTGRRIVLPGLESENFEKTKKRCGVKLLPGMGDVLKNNQDREERRKKYQFASEVNKKLYALCLKKTAN